MFVYTNYSLFFLTELKYRFYYIFFSFVVISFYSIIYLNEFLIYFLEPIEYLSFDLNIQFFFQFLLFNISSFFYEINTLDSSFIYSNFLNSNLLFDYYPVFEINIRDNHLLYLSLFFYLHLLFLFPLLLYHFFLFILPGLYYYEYLFFNKIIYFYFITFFFFFKYISKLMIFFFLCFTYNNFYEYYNYEFDVEFNILEFFYINIYIIFLFNFNFFMIICLLFFYLELIIVKSILFLVHFIFFISYTVNFIFLFFFYVLYYLFFFYIELIK